MWRKKTKFNARIVKLDGMTFQSAAESRRYLWLKDRLDMGEIQKLRVHPKFVLYPKKVGWREETYTPDFMYIENGRQVVEDVKGVALYLWLLKWRVLHEQHPEFIMREVPAKEC
jgi:hypothetical protein